MIGEKTKQHVLDLKRHSCDKRQDTYAVRCAICIFLHFYFSRMWGELLLIGLIVISNFHRYNLEWHQNKV